MWAKSLLTASAAASLVVSAVDAGVIPLLPRNDYPAQPPCMYPFTPFVYSGCYVDPSLPNRALDWSPQLNSQNMTVELCTSSCKANGFRYAGLEYYGECFCGDAVNGPAAASESDCSYACTGDSSQVCGGFDYVSIYQDTTFTPVNTQTIADYMPLGCYSEGSNGRAISFQQNSLVASTMTTEICLQACKDEGYPFAATEFASQCFCGVVIGNGSTLVDSSKCNMACNGNANEICGGPSFLNLYVATDLQEAAPCAPTAPASTSTVTSTTSTSASTTTTTTSASTTTTTTSAFTTPNTSSTSTMTTTSSTSTTPTTSTSTTSTTTSTSTTPTTTSTSTTPITTSTASTPTATSTTSTVKSTTSTSTTQTTTSTTSTVKSTTSCSTTTTSPKPTSITTTLKTSTTTSTTSSKCSVTAPAPTCEYGCGSWCSKPLPWWNDQPGCQSAAAKCALQVADCLASAGWPSALQCFEFASWCQKIQSYGSSVCAGGACSKSDCLSKNPPQGGPTTTTGICTPTSTTSHAASMTTSVCPPTATNVCVLPSGSASSGYYKGQCVGGIEPPYVTCNNIQSDFYQNPFKCYTSKESSDCPSYSRGQVSNACQDACNHQYSNCKNVYANSCQGKAQTNSQDSYSSASQKCTNQLNDCMNANRNVYVPSSRCPSFNSGWN